MPSKALIVKSQKPPKYATRKYIRCPGCGRSSGIVRYSLCRICFHDYVYEGRLPGWKKSFRIKNI